MGNTKSQEVEDLSEGESLSQGLNWGFCRKASQGRVYSVRLASLSNSSHFWATGVVSSIWYLTLE